MITQKERDLIAMAVKAHQTYYTLPMSVRTTDMGYAIDELYKAVKAYSPDYRKEINKANVESGINARFKNY